MEVRFSLLPDENILLFKMGKANNQDEEVFSIHLSFVTI